MPVSPAQIPVRLHICRAPGGGVDRVVWVTGRNRDGCANSLCGGAWRHSGAVPDVFVSRDRCALSAVLTAGLTHARLDQLVAAHPIPGDPGHDAGKAGRVGL